MHPDSSMQHYPAFAILWQYATKGFPVDGGSSWSKKHLEAVIYRGPHPYAKSKESARCLHKQAMEKVEQGEAKNLNWEDIQDYPHPDLKISLLAAVPHKSRMFQAILNLLFQLQIDGTLMPSVNRATTPLFFYKAMEQMGKVYGRLLQK